MKNSIIILTIALVGSILIAGVYGEEITVKGRLVSDDGLFHKYATVKVDRGNTVRDLGVKICQELEHQAPNEVKVRGRFDLIGWYNSHKSVEHEGIKHGDKVKVDCHP